MLKRTEQDTVYCDVQLFMSLDQITGYGYAINAI